MQEHRQDLMEMKEAYSNQSLSALKALWRSAKALPRVHAPPQHIYDANTSPAMISKALSKLDWQKPLVVDVGCGLGSFAIGLAQRAEAFAIGSKHDEVSHSPAGDKLLSGDWNVIAIDVSRVAVRRCTAVASRLGLSDTFVPLYFFIGFWLAFRFHLYEIYSKHLQRLLQM